MIKTYYMLTKPGIIMGNVLTTAAGFALASKGSFDFGLFVSVIVGLGLVVASAGVFNNYCDRDSDAKMERTKNRPLVKKMISGKKALIFASLLGVIGMTVLTVYTNLLTVALTAAGFFIYVCLYVVLKYRSIHGTLVGSLSGAMPPLVGYCAVSGRLDLGAFILFMILVLWQMPHFFAITLYRLDDYIAASIPVLPVRKGVRVTQIQMLLYIVAFTGAALSLTFFGYTGSAYFAAALLAGAVWLALGIKDFSAENNPRWARKMFAFSLVTIMVLSLMISIDYR